MMIKKILTYILPDIIFRLWIHLNKSRKRQFFILLLLILISALTEIISLGAVLPFLAVITSPESVYEESYIQPLRQFLDINSPRELILPITVLFVAASFLAASMRVLLLWFNTQLSYGSGADLSIEAYKKTLYQPYSVHITRNSSEVVSSIMTKINSATAALNLSLVMLGSSIISLAIVLVLFAIDPFIALISSSFFGISYLIISKLTQFRIRSNSRKINKGTTNSQKLLQEGLGGIRDILLDGTQSIYASAFSVEQRKLRFSQGSNYFIAGSPKFIMEALGMTLIAFLAYSLVSSADGSDSFIPILGAMALGAQRLIPSLQLIYGAWTGVSGHKDSLVAVLELLEQSLDETMFKASFKPLEIKKNISLDSVFFRYQDESPWLLEDFNLTITKGERIGVVGYTGSGKSTLIDIMMGLLSPSKGCISVDGLPIIKEKIFSLQKSIAHVPQSIFLADMTIAENIAFGVDEGLIDMQKVSYVCKQAQLLEFIKECKHGLNTQVGEQGVRLSGGQRQRIGIARALYKDAGILIFDEATSALDSATETNIMNAINDLGDQLTIIIIAHRLSTIRKSDSIIVLDSGKIIDQGTYDSLLEKSAIFKKLVSSA